uniref:Uncharacterized protein n=1 Tax=Cacopsylla melanoneura TaxID=428564 RepID=A0A8D8RIB1_9HEMI
MEGNGQIVVRNGQIVVGNDQIIVGNGQIVVGNGQIIVGNGHITGNGHIIIGNGQLMVLWVVQGLRAHHSNGINRRVHVALALATRSPIQLHSSLASQYLNPGTRLKLGPYK